MARITSLREGHQNSRVHPTEVECLYQTITDKAGAKYVQLSTLGSDDRESRPKTSQTVQIDEAIAKQLAGLLIDEFGLLR